MADPERIKKWVAARKSLEQINAEAFKTINKNLADAIANIRLAEKNLMLAPIVDQGNPYPGVKSWTLVMKKFHLAKEILEEVKSIFEKDYQIS